MALHSHDARGTIAAVTAFVVTNVPVRPASVVWLAPTVVITPIIVVWNVRSGEGNGFEACLSELVDRLQE